MNSPSFLRLAPLLLGLATVTTSCGAAEESALVFRFSAIPDEKPTEQRARFAPVASYLQEALDVPVEYVPVNQYSASVQAFKTGDVHAAWFGGLSGVQARLAVPGASAIAQGDVDPFFTSYLIASDASGLTPGDAFPMEAGGRRFTFGSEGSTSGRLMPEHFVREATGRSPHEFFATVGFAGNHPAVIAAVQSGAFEVGAVSHSVYDRASEEERAGTFVLWRTPPFADYNLTVAGDLDERFGNGFTERLAAAWLAMPAELCQQSFSRGSMIPATNEDFAAIEATALELGLARRRPDAARDKEATGDS